jgi:uncharacterized protein GlcG (DUF336 family)
MKKRELTVLTAIVLLICSYSLTSVFASEGKITLEVALKMIKAAEEKAASIGVPMVITVLDEGGNMIAQHRMDDALIVSVEISKNKAYTSLSIKMPTHKLGELAQPGKALYGIQNVNRMIIFGGGFPIKSGDKIIGAIGVSGGSVEEDMQCAQAGLAALSAK